MCPIKLYISYYIRISGMIHVSHWQRVVVKTISLSCKTGRKEYRTQHSFTFLLLFPPFSPQKRLPPSLSSCHWTMYGSWASTIEAKVVILGSQGKYTHADIVCLSLLAMLKYLLFRCWQDFSSCSLYIKDLFTQLYIHHWSLLHDQEAVSTSCLCIYYCFYTTCSN